MPNHIPSELPKTPGGERPTNQPRLLITAGPTHEPIDAVRYIGNRSSGRLGIALASAAAEAGWAVTLLLGPTPLGCDDTRVVTERFQTTSDLQGLLNHHFPVCDALVMAAAVADYRVKRAVSGAPGAGPGGSTDLTRTKLKRAAAGLTLELESTPDLLAGCAARRQPGQLVVGFALEPRDRLLTSARDKLSRKKVDMIVANPLETMNAPTIEAVVVMPDGVERATDGPIPKAQFALWLLDRIHEARLSRKA